MRVGIDAVNLSRVQNLSPSFIERYYHALEIKELEGLSDNRRFEFLASRFAIKEAFSKATGYGILGLKPNEIQVEKDENGRPFLLLHGQTKEKFENDFKGAKIDISITHENPLAIAIVILGGSNE